MTAPSPTLRERLAQQGVGTPGDRAAHLARMSITARAASVGPEEAAAARIRLQSLMGPEAGASAFAQAVCDYFNDEATPAAHDFRTLLGPVSEWLAKAGLPICDGRISPSNPPDRFVISRMLVAAGVIHA